VAQQGAREAGAPLGLGDPIVPWLYQPGVRAFRVDLYGDDLSFLQAGLPAVFASDSSLAAFYPWYHQAGDTADKLDAGALARMGRSVLGAVQVIARAPRGPAADADWFSAFGSVFGRGPLIALAVASILPGLLASRLARGLVFPARVAQAAAFGLLFWLHPVPALWAFVLPNLLPRWSVGSARRAGTTVLALLPLLSLLGMGALAWHRGFTTGSFIRPWEAAIALLALALLLVGRPGPPRPRFRKTKGPAR
jgi:hypothetical protein